MSRVVLGVTGGIAAYKACELLRRLTEAGHGVTVVPTESALRFVGTPTWEALGGRAVPTDVFADVPSVTHVRLGQQADLIMVAPATADVLARAAQGLVWVPRNEWGRRVVDQLCSFPGGRNDDIVDMCGLWGRALDLILAARAGRGVEPAGIVPFSAQWLEYQEKTNANRIF